MSLKEQVAYLKGLAEGFDIGTDSKEGKLLVAIVDTLSLMADEIDDLIENALDIGDELDAISDDLADVEEFVYEDDEDDDDDIFFDYEDDDDDDFFFDDFDDFDDFDEFEDDENEHDSGCFCNVCGMSEAEAVEAEEDDDLEVTYDVECPACGTEIVLTEDDLTKDSINCPKCNQVLEFEFEDDEPEQETAS